jgi:hsp70-interacting protein
MNVLRDEKETTERRVEALQTLRDWCEDINFAVDFHKIGGYDLIPALLNATDSAEIRALACDLIGTCAQNNPYCQETLLAARILPLVLQKLDKDTNDDVKVKALYAVSCLAREYEPGQLKLAEGNGLDIIIKSFGSPIEKLQIKCCFLCSSICTNSEIKSK